MSNSMIRSILEDKLNDKSEVDTLTDFIINKFGCISFDNVCSFALEVNENPKDTYELLFEDMNLSQKENTEILINKNYEIWKKIYEEFYGIPLEYTTESVKESELKVEK